MFTNLADKLQGILDKLKGKGKLTEKNIQEALREIKLSLLEADVNYKVVKDFIKKTKEKALGTEVLESLTPGQQLVKIVFEELKRVMGEKAVGLELNVNPPSIIMMVGLQGSGKTTHTAKLAKMLKQMGKKPLMVAGDIYRPAAIKQLEVLGENIGVEVFSMGTNNSVPDIAKAAVSYAKKNDIDVVLVDTAGRLHIDESLMQEVEEVKKAIQPDEILLVVDGMTGQEAVTVAKEFNDRLDITGVILTKLDGDARGGAALSVKYITGKPIKFIGVGEKLDAIEQFHPERIAQRILGMGDVLTFIEKAVSAIDEKKMKEMEERFRKMEFTFEDFLMQMEQIRKMGPLEDLLGMIPGFGKIKKMKDFKVDDKELNRIEAIIKSMTKDERRKPDIIDGSRKRRIARGSGVTVQEVNKLLKQFRETKKMMKQFGMLEKKMKKMGKMPFGLPGF
jgi:signal recognition particle subunit SRP54